MNMTSKIAMLALAGLVAGSTLAAGQGAVINDYPTVTRADYVFGCMQVNGQSREVLEKCSCSIDLIAGLVSYPEYEEVETIMALQQRGGESVMPLANPAVQAKVKKMKLAQVEAELRCF